MSIKIKEDYRMITKIANGIKYWAQLFLLPVYWLSFLFPRDKKIWLFGSTFGRRFADNPRYFYLYVSQMENKTMEARGKSKAYVSDLKAIRAIWISHNKKIVELLRSKDYEAYYYHSLKGIWYCLRGKVYIYDNYSKDISFWLSGGALKFNMWHGIPLKKIQADNTFDKVRHPRNGWESFKSFPRRLSDEKPSHWVLATSNYIKPIFSSAFRTKKVSTAGYPRVDGFAYDEIVNVYTATEQIIIDKIDDMLAKRSGSKIIYYMPTFRDTGKNISGWLKSPILQNILKDNNIVLVCKLHFADKNSLDFELSDEFYKMDSESDVYPIFKYTDALITDYSSALFEI